MDHNKDSMLIKNYELKHDEIINERNNLKLEVHHLRVIII